MNLVKTYAPFDPVEFVHRVGASRVYCNWAGVLYHGEGIAVITREDENAWTVSGILFDGTEVNRRFASRTAAEAFVAYNSEDLLAGVVAARDRMDGRE